MVVIYNQTISQASILLPLKYPIQFKINVSPLLNFFLIKFENFLQILL